MAKVKISKHDGLHVRVGDRFQRVDRGAAIPDYADEEHVKVLEDRGMVEEGEAFAGLVAQPGPAPFNVDEDAAKSRRSSASKDA